MRYLFFMRLLICSAFVSLLLNQHAIAETSEVRIAQGFGLAYLPIDVMVDQKLLEKHARAMGLDNVKAKLVTVGSGATATDALISNSVDVATGGVTVLLSLWDKTEGKVRGIMAICDSPMVLISDKPRIKSIGDFTEKDRIAMPAARGSHHAIWIEMEVAKALGWNNRHKLDNLFVTMKHPDATIALLSGKNIVDGHSSTVPFLFEELNDKQLHKVASSYDVAGGRHTLIVAYTTEKWKNENSKTYAALVAALKDAMNYINHNKRAAAALYVRFEKSKLSVDQVTKMLQQEDKIYFSPTPSRTMVWAKYMRKDGLLKGNPHSWKDFFWENIYDLPGT
jgi:NitT/TauT family transport system substrate-binding protein